MPFIAQLLLYVQGRTDKGLGVLQSATQANQADSSSAFMPATSSRVVKWPGACFLRM